MTTLKYCPRDFKLLLVSVQWELILSIQVEWQTNAQCMISDCFIVTCYQDIVNLVPPPAILGRPVEIGTKRSNHANPAVFPCKNVNTLKFLTVLNILPIRQTAPTSSSVEWINILYHCCTIPYPDILVSVQHLACYHVLLYIKIYSAMFSLFSFAIVSG